MKQGLLAVSLLFFATFAFAARKPPVQVTIQAPAQTVREMAVAPAVAAGYTIDSEGQFQIVFMRDMGGAQGFLTQVFLSPPACSSFRPRHLFTMLFVPNRQEVTVTMYYDYEYASALCRPARQRDDNKKVRSAMEGLLANVKTAAEQTVASAKPETPAAITADAAQPSDAAQPQLQPVPVSAPQPAQTLITAAPAPQPVNQPTPVSLTQPQQEPSLGDVARRYRDHKKEQEQKKSEPQ